MDGISIKYKGAEIAQIGASGTKTLKTGGKYCEGDITVSASIRNGTNNMHIEYENPSDISGSGNYITVVTGSDILKQVRSLDSLVVIVHSSGEGARVHSVIGMNSAHYIPLVTGSAAIPAYQASVRVKDSGEYNDSGFAYSLIDDTSLQIGSGRIHITSDGDLRVYGNTNSYPIKAGTVIVDAFWGTV